MKNLVLLTPLLLVAACGPSPFERAPEGPAQEALIPGAEDTRPRERPGALGARPPAGARTAEAFDTTSAEERAAAIAPKAVSAKLGQTVASLGAPTEPGFWLKTPLVTGAAKGRVALPSGASVNVDLIPLDGPASGGSQLSLPAMRALGVPLTDLPTVDVYKS